MTKILTDISIKFQLVEDYLHTNNQESIFCKTNCEFRLCKHAHAEIPIHIIILALVVCDLT